MGSTLTKLLLEQPRMDQEMPLAEEARLVPSSSGHGRPVQEVARDGGPRLVSVEPLEARRLFRVFSDGSQGGNDWISGGVTRPRRAALAGC